MKMKSKKFSALDGFMLANASVKSRVKPFRSPAAVKDYTELLN